MQVENHKFILAYRSIDESKESGVPLYSPSILKEGEKRIRGYSTALCIFERLPHSCCKFSYITKVDIKGSVPKVMAESGLGGLVNKVQQAYRYFERDDEVSIQPKILT